MSFFDGNYGNKPSPRRTQTKRTTTKMEIIAASKEEPPDFFTTGSVLGGKPERNIKYPDFLTIFDAGIILREL